MEKTRKKKKKKKVVRQTGLGGLGVCVSPEEVVQVGGVDAFAPAMMCMANGGGK